MSKATKQLVDAATAALNLFAKGHAIENFNWAASSLTAENIRELNELPQTLRAALSEARKEMRA